MKTPLEEETLLTKFLLLITGIQVGTTGTNWVIVFPDDQ